jgi:hypothetical protein
VPVDLLVPITPLARAKTRLRGMADGRIGAPEAYARLVVALARDILAAATSAARVRRAVEPCFGPCSAAAHRATGARELAGSPEPRCHGLGSEIHAQMTTGYPLCTEQWSGEHARRGHRSHDRSRQLVA